MKEEDEINRRFRFEYISCLDFVINATVSVISVTITTLM